MKLSSIRSIDDRFPVPRKQKTTRSQYDLAEMGMLIIPKNRNRCIFSLIVRCCSTLLLLYILMTIKIENHVQFKYNRTTPVYQSNAGN